MAEYDLTDFRMKYENGEYYINFLNNDTGERVEVFVGSDEELEEEFDKFLDDVKNSENDGDLESLFSYRFGMDRNELYDGIEHFLAEEESEHITDEYINTYDYSYDSRSYSDAFIELQKAWYKKASEFLKNN